MLFWKLSEIESTLFLHLAPALQSEQCKSPTEPQSGTARRYSGPSGDGAIRLVQGKREGRHAALCWCWCWCCQCCPC
ncbi:hypothetical protein GQ607_011007 [Colletotrichum asianum]|uniref:Uncharacterized protein n=1 Tax=Colletotrichum asianum TaxID=702518 RepID=A0A8H3W3F5_9PEZI|nr:hypothetical protein GQ607_011007 [Colletotrichum asianum]